MTDFILKKYPCLSDTNFVRFVCSQFISQTGGYIQNIALSMLISKMSGGSVMRLGIFLSVCYLPVCLLATSASKLLQKCGARRLLLVTECILFVLSAFLCTFYKMPYVLLCVFGALWGAVRAFQTPAAAATPALICDGQNLKSAVSLGTLTLALARGAGPAAAGALFTFFGVRAAFLVNTLTYIPSFFLLRASKIPSTSEKVVSKPKLNISKPLIIFVICVCLFGASYNVVLSSVAKKLSLADGWFSVFMAFLGVGAAIGSVMKVRRCGRQSALLLSATLFSLSLVKGPVTASLFAVVYGLADFLFFSQALTVISRDNKGDALLRAMGVYTALTNGGILSGYLLQSVICRALGADSMLCISALAIALVSILFFDEIR